MSVGEVAVIGAGFGGLAVARYLKSEGFEPRIFEAHSDLGGQWNRDNPRSGVWPAMRTNTAGFVTKMSDLQYPPEVPMFPRNGEVLDHINRFADMHGLRDNCQFNAKVIELNQARGGYEIRWLESGDVRSKVFEGVVVATGRFNRPKVPKIDGLSSFEGECGWLHSLEYKRPESLRDRNIVVLGGSISSLEVVSDQAMMGSGRVYLSQRRQRYVMPKMIAGAPLEYFAFTREGGLAISTTPLDQLLAETKEFLETFGGNPAGFGAPPPDPDMAKAGVAGSQHFLNLVAEDRIDIRPWVKKIEGREVCFLDGSRVEADAIVIGTGFNLHLPFLSDEISGTIHLTSSSMDLADFTFHPDLPNLAFAGLWAQLGPYPVVLEQQARWIAYTWSGTVRMPSQEDLRDGVKACVAEGHHDDYRQQHEMALRFAALCGTDPADVEDDELRDILAKSAVTGEMFRIVGPDALPDAEAQLREFFWSFAPLDVCRAVAHRHGRRFQYRPGY